MKINSIYIANFGGLKNKAFDFSSGFQVLHGQNEFGKSTIMAFIKMMFYGGDNRGSDISKKIRERYTPWSGERASGSISFEHDGRNYRLERTFLASNASDKISLIDTDLGTSLPADSTIGEKFFGLTLAAFERSVFIGQLGMMEDDSAAAGYINTKLGNLTSSGDENISKKTVEDRLDKAMNDLRAKRGRTKKLDLNEDEFITLKTQKLPQAKAKAQECLEHKKKADALEKEISSLETNRKELEPLIESEQAIRDAENYRKVIDKQKQLDDSKKALTLPDGSKMSDFVNGTRLRLGAVQKASADLTNKENEIENQKKTMQSITNSDDAKTNEQKLEEQSSKFGDDLKTLENEKSELDSKKAQLEKEHTEAGFKKKPFNLPLLIPAILLLIAGIVLFILKFSVFGIAGIAAGLVLAILAFVLKPADTSAVAEIEKELIKLNEQLSEQDAKISDVKAEISGNQKAAERIKEILSEGAQMIERQQKLLEKLTAEKQALEQAEKEKTTALFDYFAGYKSLQSTDDIENELSELEEKIKNQNDLKNEITTTLRTLGLNDIEEARERLKTAEDSSLPADIDFDMIKGQDNRLKEQIDSKSIEKAKEEANYVLLVKQADDPLEVEAEIKELKALIDAQQEHFNACNIAKEVLEESHRIIRSGYGSALNKAAAKIFSRLTRGKYNTVFISDEHKIMADTEGFGSKESAYFSSGTVDQAYLSLRLAVSELISGDNDPLPIMLDDALTQYDDERLLSALEFLNEYAQKHQIILFTCHKNILDKAQSLGAKTAEL